MSGSLVERGLRILEGLSARERRALLAATVVIAAALLYLVAFEPAYEGRGKRLAELPVLRDQVAKIEGLALEVETLTAQARSAADRGVVPPSLDQARSLLDRSVQTAGLGAGASPAELVGTQIRLRLREVAVNDWLRWQQSVLKETRLRLVEASIERERVSGRVNLKLIFERPGQGS